jgi:hypothetical protein
LAQDKKMTLANESKTLTTSVGYGFPSIIRSHVKSLAINDNFRVRGSGPFMFKSEYKLNKHFGIGINAFYSTSTVFWMSPAYDTVSLNYHDFEFGIRGKEIGIGLRGNYHYLTRSKRLDAYVGLGLGLGKFRLKSYTKAHTIEFNASFEFPRPWTIELTNGIRYSATKNLGLYAEVGVGKSWIIFDKYFVPDALVQAGLIYSFKTRK